METVTLKQHQPRDNMYSVYFENSYWGYVWADDDLHALEQVVGECLYVNGERDFRWKAILNEQ